MMGKVRDKLDEVIFACGCGHRFECAPGRVADLPGDEKHPWDYFADCPECEAEARQIGWQRGLIRAWASDTGPKTPEGIAAVTKNLEGHPTPEEAKRTRFNAMVHGLRAQTATYFPAKPGAYPHCDGCEYRYTICAEQVACLKRTELFLRHHIAFETRDPALLREDNARLQAMVRAIVDDMIFAIVKTGVEIKSPRYWFDSEGKIHLAKFMDDSGQQQLIYEINAHPLIRPLQQMIAANNMTLGDAAMTDKAVEDKDMIQGHLEGQRQDRESLLEYQEQQASTLSRMEELIKRGRENAARDPVLLDFQDQ